MSDHPGTALIARKVETPAIEPDVLRRPRLERLLASLVDRHRLIVVSATAGAGKTTAVAAATRAIDRPTAWLTVDRSDTTPGRLLAYLEAALVPHARQIDGVVIDALAEGMSHAEAGGLLADRLAGRPMLVVLDDLERLGDHSAAWEVISAFVRHAPSEVCIVFVSRRSLPSVCELPGHTPAACIDERDLAFTSDEAAAALRLIGRTDVDADAAIEATGGWVTGVLFEAWRFADHVSGTGGELDPLFGYLSSHILAELRADDREFLITTSLLDEVTPKRAAAMGVGAPGERLHALRSAHLPVSWQRGTLAMRCHPRFREYLLSRFELRSHDEQRELRAAYGRLLMSEGHHEEATEELLGAGHIHDAVQPAERAILSLVERLDSDTARRWLEAFEGADVERPVTFAVAELMLCWASEDYRGTERVADELQSRGERAAIAVRSSHAAALMGWVYYMRGRFDAADEVLFAGAGTEVDAVRYLTRGGRDRASRPTLTGGAVDLFVLFADFFAGRFHVQVPEPKSRWARSVVAAWEIAVLRATGRTRRALGMYEAAIAGDDNPLGMLTFHGPDIYIDSGMADDAREAIAEAKDRYQRIGALGWDASISLADARLALHLERDPGRARRVLDKIDNHGFVAGWLFRSAVDSLYGCALLLEGQDDAALARLRTAVDEMIDADGHIDLPSAAIYLSEAHWRAGDEEAADYAADLALRAARVQRSNHLLLQALMVFPAVASRRLHRDRRPDSPWHEIGRALMAQGRGLSTPVQASVTVREFGDLEVVVNGERVRPALAKSSELLAYLANHRSERVARDELLDALFDSRCDDSTRAYLRQAVHRLRQILPEDTLLSDGASLGLAGTVAVISESSWLLAELAEATRLQGEERMSATLDALTVRDRGEYLPAVTSEWTEIRRNEIDARCLDARLEAAELALKLGRYHDAQAHSERVLADDPFREAAWRLLMRVAVTLGDDDRAIAAYRQCERKLAELGTRPSATTVDVLNHRRAEAGPRAALS